MAAQSDLPALRYATGSTVAPGDRLGSLRQISAGGGTHVRSGHVYASVVGVLEVAATADGQSYSCSVKSLLASRNIPSVGQLVVGVVLRVSPQAAVVNVRLVEGRSLEGGATPLEGSIRSEDARKSGQASQTPQKGGSGGEAALGDCFQPGDLVACRVVGMGDARRYFLSTAEPELGVLKAVSRTSGEPMIPLNGREMECPSTGAREPRKCARPPGLASR